MSVIAADIGGTNSRFVVVDTQSGEVSFQFSQSYPSASASSLEILLRQFVLSAKQQGLTPNRACLAVAGPVKGKAEKQTAQITNLPWFIDSDVLAQYAGLQRVSLINDFEAIGHGLALLNVNDVCMLRGRWNETRGHRVVIGAGTGLGVCQILDHDGKWIVVPTESGHVDFAPRSELHVSLWRDLTRRYGHLSYDRIISGTGIADIFRFLVDQHPAKDGRDPQIEQILRADDVAAAVTSQRQHVPLARRSIDVFLELYAHAAGNFALMNLCAGGMYLAGGIAPRLLDELRNGSFLNTMSAKGRMSYLLDAMPVGVITNTQVGQLGAANVARTND